MTKMLGSVRFIFFFLLATILSVPVQDSMAQQVLLGSAGTGGAGASTDVLTGVGAATGPESSTDESGTLLFPHVPFRLSLLSRVGYDDNFATSHSSMGSLFINDGISLTYDLPSTDTRVSLRSGGDFSYYPEQTGSQNNNVNAYLNAMLGRKLSERLRTLARISEAIVGRAITFIPTTESPARMTGHHVFRL